MKRDREEAGRYEHKRARIENGAAICENGRAKWNMNCTIADIVIDLMVWRRRCDVTDVTICIQYMYILLCIYGIGRNRKKYQGPHKI